MRLLRMEVISSGLICMGKGFSSLRPACAGSQDGWRWRRRGSGRRRGGRCRPGCPGRPWTRAATLRPVRSPICVADLLDGLLVELDRARDLDGEELVLLLPQRVVLAADAVDRRHPVLLDRAARGSCGRCRRRRRAPCRGPPSSPRWRSRARRRRPPDRGSRRARRRTRRPARARRRACPLLRGLEERAAVDLGDLLHELVPAPSVGEAPRSRGRASASSTRRRWSSSVERLARDLLGGEHRQVGDLVADLLDRAPRLGLDVAAGLLHQLLALDAGPLERLLLRLSRRPCARGRRSPRPGAGPPGGAARYSARISSASAFVRSAVSIDSSIARWRLSSASLIFGNASLLRT